jgi:hypothetical protein
MVNDLIDLVAGDDTAAVMLPQPRRPLKRFTVPITLVSKVIWGLTEASRTIALRGEVIKRSEAEKNRPFFSATNNP